MFASILIDTVAQISILIVHLQTSNFQELNEYQFFKNDRTNHTVNVRESSVKFCFKSSSRVERVVIRQGVKNETYRYKENEMNLPMDASLPPEPPIESRASS